MNLNKRHRRQMWKKLIETQRKEKQKNFEKNLQEVVGFPVAVAATFVWNTKKNK